MTAVDEIEVISTKLLATLETNAPLRERRLRTNVHHDQQSMV